MRKFLITVFVVAFAYGFFASPSTVFSFNVARGVGFALPCVAVVAVLWLLARWKAARSV